MRWEGICFEMAAGLAAQLPASEWPEVAFSGRSNVGKSSLINRLTGRRGLARTSATPGKTATVNFYRLPGLRLVDLPGYGYARVSGDEKRRWMDLMESYFHQDRDLRLVVQLVDARHAPSRDDYQMMEFMIAHEIPFIMALTKVDKLNKGERAARMAAIAEELADYEGVTLVPFSSETGEGVEPLREIILSLLE